MDYQINTRSANDELFERNAVTEQILTHSQHNTPVEVAALSAQKTDVILHAFDWPYATITALAESIAEIGYRSVLVSPAMKSLKEDEGTPWWQRYQPQDYRIIDNQLGTTDGFKEMIKALDAQGVRVYADVVFNHMANEAFKRPDLQYPGTEDIEEYKDNPEEYQSQVLFGDLSEPLFHEEHFVDAFDITDWKDPWEVQNGRISNGAEDPGLPTLKACDYVIEQQQNYLRALKKLGVKGFRIDAAKHMTIDHLDRIWTDDIVEDMYIFGEIITDGGATKEEYELFLKPYIENTELGAYDFPLFNTLFQALQKDGDMASLINPYSVGQALFKFRATTFAITHDIPNNESFRGLLLDEQDEWLAYSYILGRDGGVPLVYTDFNPSDILTPCGSPRWLESWKDPRMENMILFHNYVHGEPMNAIHASKDLLIFSRGDKGIVVINKSDSQDFISIDWHKEMQDLDTKNYYHVESNKLNIPIAGRSYMLLV